MRSIALVCVLMIATPLSAAELLGEFGLVTTRAACENCTPHYRLGASSYAGGMPTNDSVDWPLTVSDFNQTVMATPAILADFQEALAGGNYTLMFQCVRGYCGDIGQTFGVQYEVVVDGLERNGWWGTRHAPMLGPGLTGYTITAVERTITPLSQAVRIYGDVDPFAPLVGDYNGNLAVDAADYVVWRKSVDPFVPGPSQLGYSNWRQFYGLTREGPPAGAAAVPEPASWLLACLALWFGHHRCRRLQTDA
jgi:hypothetical protein